MTAAVVPAKARRMTTNVASDESAATVLRFFFSVLRISCGASIPACAGTTFVQAAAPVGGIDSTA